MAILGQRIKDLREENGLTQEDLAKKLGISKSTISMYETNKRKPDTTTKEALADLFNVDMDYLYGRSNIKNKTAQIIELASSGVQIPVLGYVRAGYPIYAEENIIDYEEISSIMAAKGDFFGLRIQGNSMEPRMFENDVVIVRKQPDIESGEIAVVLVNGDEATVKKVIKSENGIMLVPLNSNCSYEPHFYTNEEIESCPVIIAGKVVEVRGKL